MWTFLKPAAAAVVSATLLADPASAQDWAPDGPIKMMVGFGAGGAADALSRSLAESIEANTGWEVVVENVPGGGGLAMLTKMQGMEADGATLGVGVSIPVWINLNRRGDQLPFNLDSFDWLATIGRAGLALVARSDGPAGDFDAFIDKAKAGGVTVATNGPAQEMIVSAIAKASGADIAAVPTKSASESIQNLLGGHVDAATLGGAHVEYVRDGQMRVLAGLAPVRDTADESVPTLMEMGYPYAVDATFYIAAPAGLSDEAKAGLSAAIDEALKSEAAVSMLKSMSMAADNLGPDGTDKMMDDGMASVGEMLKTLGN